ncbi:hypothetical protein FTX61_10965 [Nitriliruptoraceae bacterium ZYF776]|nr:hypothetical protein [Profundirhabdus halotolerans]
MPPQQCPECGRFLKNALVEGLASAPAPCPKCGIELTAGMFDEDGGSVVPSPTGESAAPEEATAAPAVDPDGPPPLPAAALAAEDPAAAPAAGATQAAPPPPAVADLADASVRPPDLSPDEVRDTPDPLAGWDAGAPVVGGPVADRRPFPTDTVVVGGAGVVGLLVGLLLGRRRGRDAAAGALAGVLVAGVARRIWRLP